MCIIRHSFIDKSGTKDVLLQLVNENYLTKMKYHEYIIYQPNLSKIHETTQKFNNINIVNQILNITEEIYVTSAIF